jgi:hypothetical protein
VRFDVTGHPTAGRLARQVTEAFPWDTAPRYLLRDRDASYGLNFRRQVDAMGITEVVTAPRSPWQNAYIERVIGSIRRECLDHIVIFNERHLRRVLSTYIDYYHRTRTPLSLEKDCPNPRPRMATQDRESRRHPASQWLASPLRTSRRSLRVTMSSNPSLAQSLHSVQLVLTGNTLSCSPKLLRTATPAPEASHLLSEVFDLEPGFGRIRLNWQPALLPRFNSTSVLATAQILVQTELLIGTAGILSGRFVEEYFGVFQVGGIEGLDEPVVDVGDVLERKPGSPPSDVAVEAFLQGNQVRTADAVPPRSMP